MPDCSVFLSTVNEFIETSGPTGTKKKKGGKEA